MESQTKFDKNRNYGIDLLRILAMFMVVMLHVLGQGGVLESTEKLSSSYVTAWFLETFAYCAVNCYALISGYVMIDSKYKYSNIVIIWLRVVFYTMIITAFFSIFMPNSVGIIEWMKAVFPAMTTQYWYFTAYICLFLFVPLINSGMQNMSRVQAKLLVITVIICFSVLQTTLLIVGGDAFKTNLGYDGLWLIVLYIIGAYVKKYDGFKKITIQRGVVGYILVITVSCGFKLVVETIVSTGKIGRGAGEVLTVYEGALISYISPTILLASIFLLMIFKQIQMGMRLKRTISMVAPLAFSIYLIHAHPLVFCHLLDNRFTYMASLTWPILIIAVLGVTLFICLLCLIIDAMREYVFKILHIKEKLEHLELLCIRNVWY